MTEIRTRHAERSQYNIKKTKTKQIQLIAITVFLRRLPFSIDPPPPPHMHTLPVKKRY